MFNPPILTGTDVATLRQELQTALQTIAAEQAQQSEYYALTTLYAAPKRILEGMIVKADGTTWNPGSGAGVYARVGGAWVLMKYSASSGGEAYPIGSIFTAVVSTDPATLLGYGTWAAFGAGKVLVGRDSGDTDFDTAEETGGAKTKAISAHSGTAVADHASHTHSVTSNVAVADHASHTHTYTQVPNHTHVIAAGQGSHKHGMSEGQTDGAGNLADRSNAASAATMETDLATLPEMVTNNPTDGVASGTTAGPSATLTHSVTNNAVTSGGSSATLTHSVTQPGAHTDLNVVQPYIVVYMWKRTA